MTDKKITLGLANTNCPLCGLESDDVLAQEFRALGYESVSFSFNAEGQSEDGDRSAGSDKDVDHVAIQNTEINDTAGPMPTTGLDLRL